MRLCTKYYAFMLLLAGWTLAPLARAADSYAQLESYDYGQSKASLVAIQQEVDTCTPDQYAPIEAKLLEVIQSAQAKPAAKVFACRMLRIVGSPKCVPVLAALLADEQFSYPARIGLQALPYPQVDDALCNALYTLHGNLQVGVITTIGQRCTAKAVAQLATLVDDQDTAVATAALISLGQIGDPAAAEALTKAKVAANLESLRIESCLVSATGLTASGKLGDAANIYRALVTKDHPSDVRIAALAGLTHTDKDQAAAALLEGLNDSDTALNAAAVHLSAAVQSEELTKAISARLLDARPEAQVLILNELADDGNRNATEAVGKLLASADENVRLASIKALGKIGDQSHVDILLKIALAKDDFGIAAIKSLTVLNAAGVDEALLQHLTGADGATKQLLLGVLAARDAAFAYPAFLTAAEDADPVIRRAALKGLSALADEKNLPALVALVVKSNGSSETESALSGACKHIADPAKCEGPVLAALNNAPSAAQPALLRVAGQLRTPAALTAVSAALKSNDADVQDAAIRVLASWANPAVASELLEIIKTDAKPVHHVLAIRGYMQITQASDLPDATRWELIRNIQPLLDTKESKTLLLSTLGALHNRGALQVATSLAADAQVAREAVTTTLQILGAIGNHALSTNTLAKLKSTVKDAELLAQIQEFSAKVGNAAAPPPQDNALTRSAINIAWQGDASSPDGWQPDGASGGDESAIDGDFNTYLDKDDNKPLYRVVVTFPESHTLTGISIYGFSHQNFAPKDFDIIIDGKVVKSIKGATYTNNYYWTQFPAVQGKTVELKITDKYGPSPGIRELGIYEPKHDN